MRGAQAVGDMLGLPEGERALAGGDAQGGHARIIACTMCDAAVSACRKGFERAMEGARPRIGAGCGA